MISLDTVNGGGQASRGEQQAGDSRRAAWMLEMERALLAANKLGGDSAPATLAPGGPQADSRLPGASAQRERQHERGADANPAAQQALVAVAKPEAASRSAATGSPVAVDGTQQAGAPAAGGDALNTPSSQLVQTAPTSATTPAAQSSPLQTAAPAGNVSASAGAASLASAALQNPVLPDQPSPVQVAVREAMAGTSLAALQAPLARVSPPLTPAALVQALNPAAVSARAGLPFAAWSLTDATQFAPAEEGETSASAPQMQFDLAQAEPIAERQLHLYQGADGVQAWIRDAELSQLQAQSVAQALSNELGLSGLKLKSLTLNGRRLERAGTQDSAGMSGEALVAATDAGPVSASGQN